MEKKLIELRELSIGNLLLFKGKYVYVSSLSMDIDDEYTDLIGLVEVGKTTNEVSDWNRALYLDLERIPLTPEILEKCGFIEKQSKWYFKDYFTDCREAVEVMVVKINTGSGRCCVADSDEGKPAYTGKRIEYLHTLQNYWYLQTGEELTVNL